MARRRRSLGGRLNTLSASARVAYESQEDAAPRRGSRRRDVTKALSLAACAAALALMAAGSAAAQGRAQLAPPAGTPMATTHLNPNTASEAQLRAVPQLGAELAKAIVAARPYPTQGAFHKVVAGKVAADRLPALYAAVFVPINLNTASNEDIMLIPGMSRRMAHEFEEYRPYKDMTQFNREIGKYVAPAEVARLASYVTLK
jgi:DNA uptake protein ComE-like DNA-binding protein